MTFATTQSLAIDLNKKISNGCGDSHEVQRPASSENSAISIRADHNWEKENKKWVGMNFPGQTVHCEKVPHCVDASR
jgi:hypothetical protein